MCFHFVTPELMILLTEPIVNDILSDLPNVRASSLSNTLYNVIKN